MATQEFKPLALNMFNAPLITHRGPRLIAVFRPASGLTAAFLSTNRKGKSGRDASRMAGSSSAFSSMPASPRRPRLAAT